VESLQELVDTMSKREAEKDATMAEKDAAMLEQSRRIAELEARLAEALEDEEGTPPP
jgi:hypothetical protein